MRSYILTIEILTPVHIGDSKGRLSPLEFFQDDKAVYIANEKAIAAELVAQGTIDDFIKYVEVKNFPTLDDFLDSIGDAKGNHLRKIAAFRRVLKSSSVRLKNLQPFIVDPVSRQPYIPGSSIKGAIRGAILFSQTYEKQHMFNRALKKKTKNPGKGFDDLLRTKLANKRDGHGDWLRFLQITDAFPNCDNCTEIYGVGIISLNNGGGYHYSAGGAKIFAEMAVKGAKFYARVNFDVEGLKNIAELSKEEPSFSLDKWLEFCSQKSKQIIAADKDFYSRAGLNYLSDELESIANHGANLRIGWGSGLLSTTLALHLSEKNRLRLRELYYKKRFSVHFPQSRKVIIENYKPSLPIGWVKLSLN